MRTKIILWTLILATLATVPAWAQVVPLCGTIPVERERDLLLACYQTARLIADEAPSTANHAQRLQLAQLIMRDPAQHWRQIADMAQSKSSLCALDWATVSWATMKAKIADAWNDVATLRFDAPVVP